MSWVENNYWKSLLISCVIVSIGALIIHAKQYQPMDSGAFLLWLPCVWLFVFITSISIQKIL